LPAPCRDADHGFVEAVSEEKIRVTGQSDELLARHYEGSAARN
jgi:hypothetical protein